jgi:hypothetical protein
MQWDHSYIPYCYRTTLRNGREYYGHHVGVGAICANCARTIDEVLAQMGEIEAMPRLSDVMSGADVTWGEQYEKGALRGVPFWIHNVRANSYENPDSKTAASQPTVEILVVDITLNGASRKQPHAVIIVGNTPERAPLLAYFNDPGGDRMPLGPCHVFEVPLKGGRSFWRIEDYDEDILEAQGVLDNVAQFDENGTLMLPGQK